MTSTLVRTWEVRSRIFSEVVRSSRWIIGAVREGRIACKPPPPPPFLLVLSVGGCAPFLSAISRVEHATQHGNESMRGRKDDQN